MKNIIFIITLLLVISCETKSDEVVVAEKSIGFLTDFPDDKWHIGTEDAIQVVKDLDAVWSKRDYEAMKTFFADTARFNFSDGSIANSPDEFISKLKSTEEDEESWTFDYAFSVDLRPDMGGEHVQAGFTVTDAKDSVTVQNRYHESYYIIEGKIVWWNSFKMAIKEEATKVE